MGRPPSPATTVRREQSAPCVAIATSVDRTPPKPTLKARSTTTTLLAPERASRTACRGKGRKAVIPTTPTRSPASRRASTASLMVPSTDPSATTTVSAPSVR